LSRPMLTRRRICASAAWLIASVALHRARALADSEPAITFDELYAARGVLGYKLSGKVLALAGKPVAMRGSMAPPLKAEADFFVLTRDPVSICPFCSSDADWPDDIVVVYLSRAATFVQQGRPIEVTGRLEVGSKIDPATGFVSLLRITHAGYVAL
jgi:hypothetical protein